MITAERVSRFVSTLVPKDFVLTVVCRTKYDNISADVFKHAELIVTLTGVPNDLREC